LITKSQESPLFTFVQVAYCISFESSQQGIQLCFRPHLNPKSAEEVMGLQSCGSLDFENFGTPKLGVMEQNEIWVLALWPSTKKL